MKLAVVCMVFISVWLAWASWFFRFAPDNDLIYLDRWTGEVVSPSFGSWHPDRASLWRREPRRGFTPVD